MKPAFIVCAFSVVLALSCSQAGYTKIIDQTVGDSGRLTGNDPAMPVEIVVTPRPDLSANVVFTVTSRGMTINVSMTPRLWAMGRVAVYRIGQELGIVFESPAATEVFKMDASTGQFSELWDEDWEGGVYAVYVDWNRGLVFTVNGNTDKTLPADFEYVLAACKSSPMKKYVIDSSRIGPITFNRAEGSKIYYHKGPIDPAKELSFDYSHF